MEVDPALDDELVDEQNGIQDTPEFHVRRAGEVTMLEASKGLDWMSMFPSEPSGATLAVAPRVPLIDVPPMAEPPEVNVADGRHVLPSMPAIYASASPLTLRAAIALATAALLGTATLLYLVLTRTDAEQIPALPLAAHSVNERLTMEALAPAAGTSPAPTLVSGLTAKPSPAPNRRAVPPSPSPTPARTQTRTPVQTPAAFATLRPISTPAPTPTPTPTSTATPSLTLNPPQPPAAAPAPLTMAAPPPGAVTTPRPTPASVLNSPPPSSTPTTDAQSTAVRSALDQYRTAYESLRAESVQAVWPAANARALARAFDQIASQSVAFDSCGIQLNAAGAEATCVGKVTFVPKVGGKVPRVEDRQWTFSLRRQNDRWIIDRVVSR